jgi:hypothetical protein
MIANEATLSTTESPENTSPEPAVGQALSAAGALLATALVAFLKGFLLCGLLNIVPILPAYKRSTGSILNRTFALFVFGPISAFVLLAFPLLFIVGYRQGVVSLCQRACAWYDKQDLCP